MKKTTWKIEGHQHSDYGSGEVWVVDRGYKTEAAAISAARSCDWIDAIVIEEETT